MTFPSGFCFWFLFCFFLCWFLFLFCFCLFWFWGFFVFSWFFCFLFLFFFSCFVFCFFGFWGFFCFFGCGFFFWATLGFEPKTEDYWLIKSENRIFGNKSDAFYSSNILFLFFFFSFLLCSGSLQHHFSIFLVFL